MSLVTTHTAIRSLYPTVTSILEDASGNFICKDKDGNSVSINLDDINTEFNKLNYKNKRVAEYPSIEDQLDTIYHSGVAGWKTTIKAIKDKYPKPS